MNPVFDATHILVGDLIIVKDASAYTRPIKGNVAIVTRVYQSAAIRAYVPILNRQFYFLSTEIELL